MILKEFLPLGLSRKGLRALLKSLSVPSIEIGRHRLVDSVSLFLALRSVLRVGEPDFLAPGSDSKNRGLTKGCRTRLDVDHFRRNLEVVVAELVYARKVNSLSIDVDAIRLAARNAAERMALAGLQLLPAREQEKYDRKAVAHLHTLLSDAPSDSSTS